MTRSTGMSALWRRALEATAVCALLVVGLAGCAHVRMLFHDGASRPAESEFGLGPRASGRGLYNVTLEPAESLAPRKLQSVVVRIEDGNGRPVENATIAVDGGMPEHGHGLPTQPKVSRRLGDGRYEIDGVRFNMGGWWEFRLAIAAEAGNDIVTFNLDL